ncbi:hypothetical protein NE237_010799 [Protea cynaroides]|uniref:Uncharacterized protein n=1 Tax=Protea cynaroides TaxID=273540 RepID=A0A9Q0L129_9MAGN|nr:hypothetical protein NE237_010799 [Protea cynaroides]
MGGDTGMESFLGRPQEDSGKFLGFPSKETIGSRNGNKSANELEVPNQPRNHDGATRNTRKHRQWLRREKGKGVDPSGNQRSMEAPANDAETSRGFRSNVGNSSVGGRTSGKEGMIPLGGANNVSSKDVEQEIPIPRKDNIGHWADVDEGEDPDVVEEGELRDVVQDLSEGGFENPSSDVSPLRWGILNEKALTTHCGGQQVSAQPRYLQCQLLLLSQDQ